MTLQTGSLLASHDETIDPGVWFIIYSDEEGALGIDITREHPDISYKSFEAVLNFTDIKPETEKLVLLGGPERPDDALVILHETSGANAESTHINSDFSFLSYNYILTPGQPPRLTTPQNRPSEIRLKMQCSFLISMGYRIFDSKLLQEQIASGQWLCLPATTDIVFDTPRRERRAKLINRMN